MQFRIFYSIRSMDIRNIIQKLPQGKTYLLETNNAGTKGIPVGIEIEFKQNNGNRSVKFQLNDISQPLTLKRFKEKYRRKKLDKYIRNNMDFESKRQLISNDEGNTISESLLKKSKNKFFDSHWHGKYIQFQLKNGTFPGYILNSNLIRLGNFIVSNVDIFKFLSNNQLDNKEKGIYNGIPRNLKKVDCFICPLVDTVEIDIDIDIDINNNTKEHGNNQLHSLNDGTQEEKNNEVENKNKSKNKNTNTNTNTKNTKDKYEKDSKNDKKKKNEKKKSLSTVQMRIAHSAEQRMLHGNYNPFDSFMDESQPSINPLNNNQTTQKNQTNQAKQEKKNEKVDMIVIRFHKMHRLNHN